MNFLHVLQHVFPFFDIDTAFEEQSHDSLIDILWCYRHYDAHDLLAPT